MPVQRNFLSEYSVGLTSKRWLMIPSDQLHADGKMTEDSQNIADSCHIYLICKREKAYCLNEPLLYKDGVLYGKLDIETKEMIFLLIIIPHLHSKTMRMK